MNVGNMVSDNVNLENSTDMFHCFPEVVDVTQLSKMLNISKTACYKLLHSREIPSMRIGRKHLLKKENIIQYINKNIG